MTSNFEELAGAVIRGDHATARTLVDRALADGAAPSDVLDGGLIPGMAVVGRRFRDAEIFLPHVLLAARAMQAGMDVLRPLLAGSGAPARGRVVLGTVRGDIHDIGKNLVGIMLQGAGFEVVDLGKDVAAERLVDAALKHDARVIGLSALLTTTMERMRDTVELVRRRGVADRLRVIVGGAPVTEAFAREIGADAWAKDATDAVERIRELVGAA
jgi:5-methyltetrahydrofolate--homocysteine methyltransferase